MRKGIVNGNGAICDVCMHPMKPFEIYRITGKILVPEEKYPEVTSDTHDKTIDKFHLCERCYGLVIKTIQKKDFRHLDKEGL